MISGPEQLLSASGANLSDKADLNNNNYGHTNIIGIQIKWWSDDSLQPRQPNVERMRIKITLMLMTDEDTGDIQGDGAARIAVLLPVWIRRRCTLECVP